ASPQLGVILLFVQPCLAFPFPPQLVLNKIWDARVQQSSSLYNGTKFRYGGYNFDVGNDPKQESHVSLHLSLTDYRTFMGANLSSMWERFLVSSEDDCIQCQHTSSPLGNGAVVETSDRRILVLQRSNKVGEFPGYFVFPGGHPEAVEKGRDPTPSEVHLHAHTHDLMENLLLMSVPELSMKDIKKYYGKNHSLSLILINVKHITKLLEEQRREEISDLKHKVITG
ncbi:nudix hydrolase 9-like, partial [Lycium ferocissimum]|uniref:nudix hydrolase 9-like n=1 Tax=Lycium ferocissimum TaxID=112874 RepID=UPI002814A288